MMRAIRQATLAGALLLGAGCGTEEPPEPSPSPIVTPTQYVDVPPQTTLVSGNAWDPEAFWFSWATCGALQCPLQPVLSDLNPLYQRAAVHNANVAILDPLTGQFAAPPVTTGNSATGEWTVPAVPLRQDVPFFAISGFDPAGNNGSLVTQDPPFFPPGLPPVPQSTYLPTVTMRPIATRYSFCLIQESLHLSDIGILDAVARYRSVVEGQPTTVWDFIDPTKYAGVTVFWMFGSGFPTVRGPAVGTTIEASAGQVYNVSFTPPGTGVPDELLSPRWFFVANDPETISITSIGISVILHPAGSSPAQVTYTFVDPLEDPAQNRPWKFAPITAPLSPGVISFGGFQVYGADYHGPNPHEGLPPYYYCLP